MGLAPYGEPRYSQLILDNLIDLKPDGSFRLDMQYFNYCGGLTMINEKFIELFGSPQRTPNEPLDQKHMDLAASVQAVVEEAMLRLTRFIAKETSARNLCLAGGVALNCVANGKIKRDASFENIWVQPASGDAGGALGAALAGYYYFLENPRKLSIDLDHMNGSFLGPSFNQAEIEASLSRNGAVFQTLTDEDLLTRTAQTLRAGMIVGWFQGRMEFGPRALGARSILGDARSPEIQKTLNLKIKYRESFRPFAPAVLSEHVSDWFEFEGSSPYMLMVAKVNSDKCVAMSDEQKNMFGIDKLNIARSSVPAITHVDYSARIQTVHAETNPRFHDLLSRFRDMTGCPILVNTSFNVRGEPIVGSPEDAFRCFMGTDMDVLVIGNCILEKSSQTVDSNQGYRNSFEMD